MGRRLLLILWGLYTAFAFSNELSREQVLLRENFGAGNVRAEQERIGKVPRPSNELNIAVDILRMFDDGWTRNAEIPEEYRPDSGNVMPLPFASLPSEDYLVVGESQQALETLMRLLLDDDGRLQVPFHPLQLDRDPELAALVSNNPSVLEFLFSPTSSTRGVYTFSDSETYEAWNFISKLSIPASTSGASRMIKRPSAAKAVIATKHMREAHNLTEGKLEFSGMNWMFFPESWIILPKDPDSKQGGRIFRNRPFNSKKFEYHPAYELNVKTEEGRKFVRELFENSGYEDFDDFVIEKLVLPHWELHLMMAFRFGHPMTTHGQNNGYLVDKKTGQVVSAVAQDLSVPLNLEVRWLQGHSHGVTLPEGLELKDLGIENSRKAVLKTMRYFKQMFVDQVFSMVLTDSGLRKLRSSRLQLLKDFAKKYYRYEAKSFAGFRDHVGAEMKKAKQAGVLAGAEPLDPSKNTKLYSLDDLKSSGVETPAPSSGESFSEHFFDSLAGQVTGLDTLGAGQIYESVGLLTSPHPISVPADREALIREGIDQRLKAVSEFFKDYLEGGEAWKAIISPEMMEFLLKASGLSEDYVLEFDAEELSIFMGADFFVDQDSGEIIYMEDQMMPAPGRLAFADMARNTAYSGIDGQMEQYSIYRELTEFYKEQFKKESGREPVMVFLDYQKNRTLALLDDEAANDNKIVKFENRRLAELTGIPLVTMGLEDRHLNVAADCFDSVVDLFGSILGGDCSSKIYNTKDPITGEELRITVRDDDTAILERRDRSGNVTEQPIDLILNRIMLAGDKNKDPLKMTLFAHSPALQRAVDRGQVELSTHPLALLASNKYFQAKIESMIETYLEEKPKLKMPDWISMADSSGEVKREALNQFYNDPENWVIKKIIGFGGKQTFIGSSLSTNEIRNLSKQIKNNPRAYMMFRYHEPSQIHHSSLPAGSAKVHYRYFSALYKDSTFVASHGMASLSPVAALRSNRSNKSVFAVSASEKLLCTTALSKVRGGK